MTRGTIVIFAALVACGATDAQAQQPRPYRAIFGGAGADPNARQVLDLTVSLAEAYDANILADDPTGLPPAQLGGFFTALSGDLRFMRRGQRLQLSLNAVSDVRYFNELGKMVSPSHALGAGVTVTMGPRTTLSLNESVSYAPSYFYSLFARPAAPAIGDVVPTATDYATNDRSSYTSSTTANLTRRIGRRASFDALSSYRRTTFADPVYSDLMAYNVGGRFGFSVGRDVQLRLGYIYRRADYAAARRPTEHDIDVGVDYDRPLSRSRRTRLRFSAGSSVLEGPSPLGAAEEPVKQFRAVGNVLLTHQIGRTWSARAAYRRGAQYVEELTAPVFTDSVTFTADGFVNRKTDVTGTAAYSTGAAVSRPDSSFVTYTASVRARTALTRSVAVYVEYLYYSYDFDEQALLGAAAPRELGRNGVRVGLTFWIPVTRN